MASSYYNLSTPNQISHQHTYADASQAPSNVPQSHHAFPPQHFYPDPHAHHFNAQAQAQSQAQAQAQASSPAPNSLQSHGLPFDSTHQQSQPSLHPQMQPHLFAGYNPGQAESSSPGSMPPPSTMGSMAPMNSFGATMQQGMPQRTPQSYQPQMRQSKSIRRYASLAYAGLSLFGRRFGTGRLAPYESRTLIRMYQTSTYLPRVRDYCSPPHHTRLQLHRAPQ